VASHHAAKAATLGVPRHSSFHELATRQYLNGQTKRGETVSSGGVWREGHGLSVESEVRGLSSRERRAAPRLQMPIEEPVVASYGLAKAATLTIPQYLVPPSTPQPTILTACAPMYALLRVVKTPDA